MVVRMKNCGGSLKNQIFNDGGQGGREGGHEKPLYKGELSKKEGLGQFAGLRWALAK